MAINVETRYSPGWWLRRQMAQLADRNRQARLQELWDWYSGNGPLPEGAENAREAYQAFQKKARTNFAQLIVAAVSERMSPIGFRTAVDNDETGDAEVGALWDRAGMEVIAADVHDKVLAMSEMYALAGPVDPETGAPRITAEDPRHTFGERDPDDKRRLLAGVKVVYDDHYGEDRAYLFLPGRVTDSGRTQIWVARRRITPIAPSVTGVIMPRPPGLAFDPRGWEWDPQRSGELAHPLMPMVRFDNKDDMGEFEPHLDVLGRINHQVLQELAIAIMQAFRQRAVKGMPLKDKAGKTIDYTGMFTSDPAAFWLLPKESELWESAVTDLTPIVNAIKSHVQYLAAVTRTPMSMMLPAGENQSAEGANFQREGLVFKTGDRISRCSGQWARLMSVALVHAGMVERADLGRLQTMWAPPHRLSLAERADAAVKLEGKIPRRMMMTWVLGLSPAEAERAMSEFAYDDMLAAQVAGAMAAANPQPAIPGQPGQNPPQNRPQPALPAGGGS